MKVKPGLGAFLRHIAGKWIGPILEHQCAQKDKNSPELAQQHSQEISYTQNI